MPKVIFAKTFRFSPDGFNIVEYPTGEAEVSDRCAEVAAEAGALVSDGKSETEETKKPTNKKK